MLTYSKQECTRSKNEIVNKEEKQQRKLAEQQQMPVVDVIVNKPCNRPSRFEFSNIEKTQFKRFENCQKDYEN